MSILGDGNPPWLRVIAVAVRALFAMVPEQESPARRPGGRTTWPCPMRAQAARAGTRFRWSGLDGATPSGAVSAGSNPVGGTGQRHKFEHPYIIADPRRKPLTCGDADAFQTCRVLAQEGSSVR